MEQQQCECGRQFTNKNGLHGHWAHCQYKNSKKNKSDSTVNKELSKQLKKLEEDNNNLKLKLSTLQKKYEQEKQKSNRSSFSKGKYNKNVNDNNKENIKLNDVNQNTKIQMMEMEYAYKRLERENKNQLLEVNKLRKKLTILENKVNEKSSKY